jgi:Domain of Unknown Function (DUF1080)/PA14 domain
MKTTLFHLLATFWLALLAPALAQAQRYALSPISLNDLSGFRPATQNWQVVGQVAGSYTDTNLKTSPGTGILANLYTPAFQYKPESNLFSQLEHGDLYLELDFMMPQGSNSGIYFQSRYEVQLYDSWNATRLEVKDCGSIYERWDDARPEGQRGFGGRPARTNAALAPGLWQHLEVEFQAPRFDAAGRKVANARFVKVVLNGVTIHENVDLTGPTRAAAANDEKPQAPLMIQGDHGQVCFRNFKYAQLGDLDLKIHGLAYEYFETTKRDFAQLAAKELTRKGSAEALDYRLADLSDKFALRFTGELEVPTTDTYTFMAYLTGNYELWLDGQKFSPDKSWSYLYGSPAVMQVPLTAGRHPFKFQLAKQDSWAPTGLALFVQKPNTRPLALHAPSSLPPLPQPGLIELPVAREPELLRSFLAWGGRKKTHCLSVSDPAGVHYSYDLDQATLLQVWKGRFLNLNEMWFERGEPQTAEPLGARLVLAGTPPLAPADSPTLPDSISTQTLVYQGYTLDAQRYPTFRYAYEGQTLTDQVTPSAQTKGLKRTLKLNNGPTGKKLVFRVAEGVAIDEISPGLYGVNQQQYFVQVPAGQGITLNVKSQNGKKILVAESNNGQINYELIW